VDTDAVRRLAKRQVEAGVHFLVPCGTTGEAPTLSAEEQRDIVSTVADAAKGRVPILAGAGGYDTAAVCRTASEMASAGADGLLSVTPYYNKPSQEGLYRHFATIAESTPLPIVLYDVPGRTGCQMTVETLARLAEIPTIVGVKQATGNVTAMCEALEGTPDDFIVLSGDDALTLPLMSVGGHGVISVVSNEAPADMARMVELAELGDFVGARAIHCRLLRLMLMNFVESNPIPVKWAMGRLGLMDPFLRPPLAELDPRFHRPVEDALRAVGLVEAQAAVEAVAH
jgi:4-hydroxy-tetrahydrodipicolinate synthase